jgi:5-deoxy-glucuronate isomerase
MAQIRAYTPKEGYTPVVRRGRDEIKLLELGMLRVAAGGHYRSATEGDELVIVLFGGLANVQAGDMRFDGAGGRASVFGGRATAVYVPAGTRFRIDAVSAVEAALVRAPAEPGGAPALVLPEQVKVVPHAQAAGTVEEHWIIGPEFPAQRLFVGETHAAGGTWAHYPPHKHDQALPPEEAALEEVDFFRFDPPGGFALQYIYTPGGDPGDTLVLGDDSVVKIPHGFHPIAVPPAWRLFSLWALAGQERAWAVRRDPDHPAPAAGGPGLNHPGDPPFGASRTS